MTKKVLKEISWTSEDGFIVMIKKFEGGSVERENTGICTSNTAAFIRLKRRVAA